MREGLSYLRVGLGRGSINVRRDMPKIVFIGAGSAKFVREVVVDLFSFDELKSSHIELMDIDAERVRRSHRIVEKIIGDLRIDATVASGTDQRRAIEGADYVIITIMVGGFKHYKSDVEIPAKFGVMQAISDTSGPGGVFRTIRTTPVLQGIARDIRELAPNALVLNYANPMSMNCLAFERSGIERVVGLCHSIQHMYRKIAGWLGLDHKEITYTAAGINHVDFYLTLQHRGRDLYPALRALAQKPGFFDENPQERVRFDLMEYLGYFPAEGPWHQTEYYGWFRKNAEQIKHYAIPTGLGHDIDLAHNEHRTAEIEKQLAGEMPINYSRSLEYGARIIHAIESDDAETFYGNVPNRGLIPNLPADAIVEVPCVADRNGIFPCRVAAIPAQLAAVMTPHIHLHDLAVGGTMHKDRRLIYQAVQCDPLTNAMCSLPQIREMVDALFEENAAYVRDWK